MTARVDPAHYQSGARYDRTRFRARATRMRFMHMERVVLGAIRECERVLDVGCGTGRLTRRIAAPTVVGLDRARGMLAGAHGKGLRLVRGDAHALPFGPGGFDGIVSTDSVFSQLDWERAFAECARVLRPGGVLVVHQPSDAIWSPRRPWRWTPGWTTRSPRAFVASALDAGLMLDAVRLWRWLRVPPFLVPMPARVGWRTWNHGVFVFRKR